jgi:glycosyltransferase involved in cell wall biosynthesis
LVANYQLDTQRSMLRLADLLESGLRSNGIDVSVIRPEAFFGLFAQRWFTLHKWLCYLDKFILFPFRLLIHARRSLLVHIVDHSNAVYCLWLNRTKSVVTCNDLLAVRSARGELSEHETGFAGKLLQEMILAGLRRATHLACISEATRKDVLRLSGRSKSDVSCIYVGLEPIFGLALSENFSAAGAEGVHSDSAGAASSPPESRAELRYSDRGGYLLHVGGDAWYKNRPGVLDIYLEIRKRLGSSCPDLVMVGPSLKTATEGVHFCPCVTDEELAGLYRKAALLLFPSFYEGFGWPVVEAQACGCPAVITGAPPLTEAGGNAAAWIADPRDIGAAADQVIKILGEDRTAREERIFTGYQHARKFSLDRMIARYLELYAALLR